MSKAKKKIFKIISFFCLLIVITIAPKALLHFNNAQLTDVPNITELSVKAASDETAAEQNCNPFQRIKDTKTALAEKADTLVGFKENNMPEKVKNQLVHTVEKQLSDLQNLHALPELTYPDELYVNVSKRSYIHMQNPYNPINIWGIQINYPEYYVNVYLDIDTSLVYEVSIIAKADYLNYNPEEMSPKGFLEYLQRSASSVEYDGERFYTMGSYAEDSIRLFVLSQNGLTQAVTDYTFGESDTYMITDRLETSYYEPDTTEQY